MRIGIRICLREGQAQAGRGGPADLAARGAGAAPKCDAARAGSGGGASRRGGAKRAGMAGGKG